MKNFILLKIIYFVLIFLSSLNGYSKITLFRVTGDKLNVRSSPSIKSKIVVQLRIASRVTFIKKSGIKDAIGGKKGEWIFVETEENPVGKPSKPYKGWIFDYYLVGSKDLSSFKRVNSFKKCIIKAWQGDYLLHYEFKKDGSYIRKVYDYEKDKIIERRGVVYKYQNLYLALDEDGAPGYFYIRNDGIVCNEDHICEDYKQQ